ncbi:MAG TPA: 3-hydroxyacyl-CoA dehydrogenase family protein [Chitinophagaceae bacterium]|nr:3-hydroxyacyl-CoA dehydrogenase family protein [Chitinophagaceae bacterium]
MKLAVVADDLLKKELMSSGPVAGVELIWLDAASALINHRDADAVIDLLFQGKETEITFLKNFLPVPVIINDVNKKPEEIIPGFIRINGWPTFLKREIIECSNSSEETKKAGERIFSALGKKANWVPDIAGFITPRIIALIINEAYLAMEEEVSTKEEIDTAMKLGTNYPYGPFEWAEKIGFKKIHDLLIILSEKESRYQPAPLLIKAATEKN